MTLSGGASLGAFEAGAAAALVEAWRHLDHSEDGVEASIDAIGGASAGAIVGLFTAHCVLSGADPVALLREAWVEKVSLNLLRGSSAHAPLSFDELRERLPDMLRDHDGDDARRQERPLVYQVSLTGLRGLAYPIRGFRRDAPIRGITYAAGRSLHGADEDAHHLNVLIDPRSEVSAGDEPWSDPESDLSWQTGTSRALAILSQQDLFEDLRRIEKDNSRLRWIDDLTAALEGNLGRGAETALREFVESVRKERADMRADEPDSGSSGDLDGMDASELLRCAIAETAGLEGKQRLSLDVISPLLLTDDGDGDTKSLLAGEFMGDFGGFLSEELRASDFNLGYESGIAWLEAALPECELPEGAAERTVDVVRGSCPPGAGGKQGKAEISDISLRDRLELVRLAGHTARVMVAGAVDVRSRIPDSLGRFLRSGSGTD